jgi:glutathione S-transferase
MPLTGGYRKTPVLQIDADIYCDTQLILREIERRAP